LRTGVHASFTVSYFLSYTPLRSLGRTDAESSAPTYIESPLCETRAGMSNLSTSEEGKSYFPCSRGFASLLAICLRARP